MMCQLLKDQGAPPTKEEAVIIAPLEAVKEDLSQARIPIDVILAINLDRSAATRRIKPGLSSFVKPVMEAGRSRIPGLFYSTLDRGIR